MRVLVSDTCKVLHQHFLWFKAILCVFAFAHPTDRIVLTCCLPE